MSKDMNMDGEPNEYPDSVFDHLAAAMDGESAEAFSYRKDLCFILANKVKDEFGLEGLCELLTGIDNTAGWISDILIESSDVDNILFQEYGIYVKDSLNLARKTKAMEQFSKSLWRSRRKYAKLMAAEIHAISSEQKSS